MEQQLSDFSLRQYNNTSVIQYRKTW